MVRYLERVSFRFIVMPCCGHQLCWVNPRPPNHCPECGVRVYPEVRSCVHLNDDRATLQYKTSLDEAAIAALVRAD